MSTVTIGTETFTVYQDVEEIDAYVVGAYGDAAAAWRAIVDADDKARIAVSVTRLLDRQSWAGEPTDSAQALAWPRTGLLDAQGQPLDPDTIPAAVLEAADELAMATAAGEPTQTDPSQPQTRSLKAGSVAIEYFRPIDAPTILSQTIMQLVGLWLGGGAALVGVATGVDGCTNFDREYRFTRGF
jgi:hypothetical protein